MNGNNDKDVKYQGPTGSERVVNHQPPGSLKRAADRRELRKHISKGRMS